ncbi:hypothetical protein FRX31_007861 [Thalictrum thalictroides]|uniref:Uncharacterized protein n=1 Tax=Thalictrum thalictroides TaxID=46969 RepID=A0A7J6X2K9_THATH|nr:hypothetical protein FRX31_007861 [Thalictrum thalictroides]
MDSDKKNKKRQVNWEVNVDERRTKLSEDSSKNVKKTSTTEAEVEEFFAMIRILHSTNKYFKDRGKNVEDVGENIVFDLNADPE